MGVNLFNKIITDLPHIYEHGVNEVEVEDILRKPGEDRLGREGTRVAIGQTKLFCI